MKTSKGTVMQIEKALINDRLRVSKIPCKFRIPIIYNFAVIVPWNFLFAKVDCMLILSIFLFINKVLRLNNFKYESEISMCVICVEAIIYLLLYNVHDCTFKGMVDHEKHKAFLVIFHWY